MKTDKIRPPMAEANWKMDCETMAEETQRYFATESDLEIVEKRQDFAWLLSQIQDAITEMSKSPVLANRNVAYRYGRLASEYQKLCSTFDHI